MNETAILRRTPLHLAVLSGSWETVEVLLKESGHLKVSEADWQGFQPVHYARLTWKTGKNEDRPASLPLQTSPREDAVAILQMLEGFDVEGLRNERQSYVDTANAILVGAALIVGIAFASWLQPPLGFQPTYSSQFLELNPLAPPNTYQPSLYIHGRAMIFFVFFNTMSFFFAIGSFLLGAAVGFPTRYALQTVEIQELRVLVTTASGFLIYAVVCIVVAFICAGFAVLPSLNQSRWDYMIMHGFAVSLIPCVFGMLCYLRKLFQSLGLSKHYFRKKFESLGLSKPTSG